MLGLRSMRLEPTPAAMALRLAGAFLSASAGYGRGERSHTTATDLNVPARLQLRIELTGLERWLRDRSSA